MTVELDGQGGGAGIVELHGLPRLEAARGAVVAGGPVLLVEFWGAGCPPCDVLAPMLERLAREMAGRLVVAKLDAGLYPEAALRFEVTSVPTMILFGAGGRELLRGIGLQPYLRIVEFVEAGLRMHAGGAAV